MKEERFSPWEESDQTEEKPARNRFESIMDFLHRDKEDKTEKNEDEEDEGTEKRQKGKSSRWRKFMRELFGGGTEGDADEYTEQPRRPALILFEPVPVLVEDAINRQEDITSQPVVEASNTGNLPEEPHPEVEIDSRVPELDQEEPDQGVDRLEPNKITASQPTESEHSTSKPLDKLNRASIAPGLLALDYFNYRGRKKLAKKVEQEQKKQDEKLKGIKDELLVQRQQLEKQKPQSERALDTQKQHSQRIEQPKASSPTAHEEPVPANAERYTEAARQQQLEKLKESQKQQRKIAEQEAQLRQEQRQAQIEKLLQFPPEELPPDLAQETSAYIEKEYEQRHESLDKADTSKPTSVGAVLSSMQSTGSRYSHATYALEDNKPVNRQNTISETANSHVTQKTAKQQQLYFQAAKSGFIAAITLIAVVTTIVILR